MELEIVESYDFPVKKVKGILSGNQIILNMREIKNKAELNCILAEEVGHYHTASGDILDQNNIVKRKIELQGKKWAYQHLVPLEALIEGFELRLTRYELIDKLNITEDFFHEAIESYKKKYGCYVELDKYLIVFEPNLQIIKWF
ncbi:ImmA/IrrE family metallo-endopeptidase [Proteiniclasticum sp. C24MP]|uniref:ImmA/IrrE family metallo-endopeptidase n=1 Tax=Proteiniclasticum sp. C24MP TaxID=3374101 RepID=UPI003754938D